MTDFNTLAHERYSCRKLSDKPVEHEKLDAILDAAVAAPTAVNKQPWHAWVIQSPEAIEKLGECTKFLFGAKVAILVGGAADEAWVRDYDERNFEDVDATIVATHVMLAAQDLGLSTCWVGKFDAPKVQELFPQTAGYDLVALFPIGYAASDAKPSPRHVQRKAADELVSWL